METSNNEPIEEEVQTTEEELTTLKEIVQQSLETQGVLAKIRAQLRAAVFTTIDGNERKTQGFTNQKVIRLGKSKNLMMASALFLDFLDTLDLDSTKSVFQPEIVFDNNLTRDEIAKQMGIVNYSDDTPLIFNILNNSMNDSNIGISDTLGKKQRLSPNNMKNLKSPKTSQLPSLNITKSPNTKINQLDNELQALIDNDKSGKVKEIAKIVGGPGDDESQDDNNNSNSANSSNNNNTKEHNNYSLNDDDDYGNDGFEDIEEIQDDLSLAPVEEESLDLDQSVSLGESSGFLSMSGGGAKGSYDKEELSMSTSIVQDSMELSVQNSRALDEYDFIEVVQKPNSGED
jgi:hypothetical protein